MNLIKAREKEVKRHENCMRTFDLIDEMELEKEVSFCDGSNIFTNYSSSFPNALRFFADKLGKYKLNHYYVSEESLAINYRFGNYDVTVILFVPLSVIDQVSEGKCRIESQGIIEKTVVCDI